MKYFWTGILISCGMHALGAILVWGLAAAPPALIVAAPILDLDMTPSLAATPILAAAEKATAVPIESPMPQPVPAIRPSPPAQSIEPAPIPLVPPPAVPAAAATAVNDFSDSLAAIDDLPDNAALPPPENATLRPASGPAETTPVAGLPPPLPTAPTARTAQPQDDKPPTNLETRARSSVTENVADNVAGASPAVSSGNRLSPHDYSRISARLRQHLRYPSRARKMGWEGKVLISFRVDRDGVVNDLKVVASSGHAILDESALTALRQAAPFTNLAREAQLVLPVTYCLR